MNSRQFSSCKRMLEIVLSNTQLNDLFFRGDWHNKGLLMRSDRKLHEILDKQGRNTAEAKTSNELHKIDFVIRNEGEHLGELSETESTSINTDLLNMILGSKRSVCMALH